MNSKLQVNGYQLRPSVVGAGCNGWLYAYWMATTRLQYARATPNQA